MALSEWSDAVQDYSNPRALIWLDGHIEQLDDARGARLLNDVPEITQYAQVLPPSGISRARFTWVVPRGPWVLASFNCVNPRGG